MTMMTHRAWPLTIAATTTTPIRTKLKSHSFDMISLVKLIDGTAVLCAVAICDAQRGNATVGETFHNL